MHKNTNFGYYGWWEHRGRRRGRWEISFLKWKVGNASPFWVKGEKKLQSARKLKFRLRGVGATRRRFWSNDLHTSSKWHKQIYRSNQKNETVVMAPVSSPNSNVLKMTILPILLFNLFNQSIDSTIFHTIILLLFN